MSYRDIVADLGRTAAKVKAAGTKTSADLVHSINDLGKKLEAPGAPILPGSLERPESGNVNAMREALDTQKEMEVGKSIEQTQAETDAGVKAPELLGSTPVGPIKSEGKTITIVIADKKTVGIKNHHTFVNGGKDGKCKACGQPYDADIHNSDAYRKKSGTNGEFSDIGGVKPVDLVESKEAGFNFWFPGQVLREFRPQLQHEIVDYPNQNNSPMIEDIDIGQAIEAAMTTQKLSYVSTSPGGIGIGRDGKPQVLDGAPLRKEQDIRGPMFTEEFYAVSGGIPDAVLTLQAAKLNPKSAAGTPEEIAAFRLFLNKVCGEIAATMVSAFKVTHTPLMDEIPGQGEVQLAQIEQPSILPSFATLDTHGSRTAYLLEKLNDSEIRDAVNQSSAQASVWHEAKEGGFVYEVFVRGQSIDTDSLIFKYEFITGTREASQY